MNDRKEKWKTWWWYHKIHVLIAAAVIALALYAILPGLLSPKPDYSVAVITASELPEETHAVLKERFREIADDRNGDGKELVELFFYTPDLSGKTPGTQNYQEAARLDADLVGKVSSIFLVEDMEGYRKNVAVPVEPEVPVKDIALFDGILLPEGTAFTVRSDGDAQEIYDRILRERIKSPETEEEALTDIETVVGIRDNVFSCSFDGVKHGVVMDLPEESGGAPLVMMLHGYGNTAESFRTAVHFEKTANEHGYAVVYVTGAPDPNDSTSATGWNSEGRPEGNRDADFLVALAKHLQREYSLDPGRTYAVGFSNGAAMVHRLAAEADGTFSAFVSVAGWMPERIWKERKDTNAVSFLQITGEKDKAVSKHSDGSAKYTKVPAIEDVMAYWAESNGLEPTETALIGKGSVLTKYTGEGNAQQVWNLLVKNGQHSWPDEKFSGINTNALILDFFEVLNQRVD